MNEAINFTEKVHNPKSKSGVGLATLHRTWGVISSYELQMAQNLPDFLLASVSCRRSQQTFYLEALTRGGAGVASRLRTQAARGSWPLPLLSLAGVLILAR